MDLFLISTTCIGRAESHTCFLVLSRVEQTRHLAGGKPWR
jgi:hypothetical protein